MRSHLLAASLLAGAVPSLALTASAANDSSTPSGSTVPPDAGLDLVSAVDLELGLLPEHELEAALRQQFERVERAVDDCMHEAGLEYHADTRLRESDRATDPFSPEYAQQRGFGIYAAMSVDNSAGQGGAFVSPANQKLVDSLDSAQSRAWVDTHATCTDAARRLDAVRDPAVQEVVARFGDEVAADPRVERASDAWRSCMATAGHPFRSFDEMMAHWYQNSDELRQRFFESKAWEADSPDYAEWQRLADEEIADAVASATCTPAYFTVVTAVRRELRPQLVDALEELTAAGTMAS